VIELRGVCRQFREGVREHRVLDHLDCSIAAGELVVVLGKSGSGKSTLLNLIAGIDLPDSGSVEVAGVDLGALDETARTLFRRHHIGFVFQFFHLVPTLSVLENVVLPLELAGRADRVGRERARELLAEVGLADRLEAFPDVLSGGEQQRVAVARALVHQPEVVLADEPTGNLDQDAGVQVVELLDRLTRRVGRTLVMVTHSREMAGVADRVLRMDHGRLIEDGGAG
jgi:putative ABC transport system ATP-binding protein